MIQVNPLHFLNPFQVIGVFTLFVSVPGERLPVLSDRQKMPYAEATLREILRRATTPFGVPVATLRDTKLGNIEICILRNLEIHQIESFSYLLKKNVML